MTDIVGTSGNDTLDGTPGDDYIRGLAGDDVLRGFAGNDILDGGTGNDTMSGGLGNDTYYVDSQGDIVTEVSGEGVDRVAAAVSYYLPAGSAIENLEAITLSDTTALNLGGNAFDNTVVGNAGANVLSGDDGNDTLIALGGNDILDGGLGLDTMYGGTGDDLYYVNYAGDVVMENPGEGTDRVATSVSYALTSGSAVEVLEPINLSGTEALNLTGNAYDNTIHGNNGANVIKGDDGNDSLFGFGGDDSFVGGPGNDFIDGGDGTDLVLFSGAPEGYQITQAPDGTITIKDIDLSNGNDGTDTIVNVEKFQFGGSLAPQTLTVDQLSAASAQSAHSHDTAFATSAMVQSHALAVPDMPVMTALVADMTHPIA